MSPAPCSPPWSPRRGDREADWRAMQALHHDKSRHCDSLNVGSVQPPQTQGKVQSAVRLALSGMYLLQASPRTGLIDCQMISNVPEALILPIMTGFERW